MRAFVGDFEYNRMLISTNGQTYLHIKLGPNYAKALKILQREVLDIVAFYYFARIFEASDFHGESGVHHHITELIFLPEESYSEGNEHKLPHDRPITPTIARLDFDSEAYDRLRRGGRLRGQGDFPPFEKVGA